MLLKREKVKVKAKTYFGWEMGFSETLGHLKNPLPPLLSQFTEPTKAAHTAILSLSIGMYI